MGQLVKIADVYEEFTAQALRDALRNEGIPCLVFNNEIPMEPGFTFDLRPWGAVLVTEENLPVAREITADVLTTIHGEHDGQASVMPAQIQLNSRHWVGGAYLSFVCLEILSWLLISVLDHMSPESPWRTTLLSPAGTTPEAISILAYVVAFNIALGIVVLALMYLNWERLWRSISAALIGLVSLPLFVGYALFWLLRSAFFGVLRLAHGHWP